MTEVLYDDEELRRFSFDILKNTGMESHRSRALRAGVSLLPGIMGKLTEWAEKYGVTPPEPCNL